MVTEVTISVLVNELRGLQWKHSVFQQSSIMVWRDAVKRWFITSGELGLGWHWCQVCGVRSCFCVFVYWGLSGGCKPRQLVCACVHVLVHGVEDYSVRECQYICSACALKNHQKILISPEA